MSILTVQAGVCTIRRPYPQKTVERISPGGNGIILSIV